MISAARMESVRQLRPSKLAGDLRQSTGRLQVTSPLLKFDKIGIWKKGDQRAPHKPLLILYALGKWQNGQSEVTYLQAESDLSILLREFGPPRRSDHPEQPFWRLQNDGVWTVHFSTKLATKKRGDIPLVTALRSADVRAGFTDEVKAALANDPALVTKIATNILERHFPESIHPDILSAVGLTLGETVMKRDPHFRQKILTAYEWKCAVCGFDVRLGTVSIALDAAHIRWHQAGGPSKEANGLALCVLHHKTFDLGAFTLSPAGVLFVSDQANGSAGFAESLLSFHGRPIRTPQRPEWAPHSSFVGWHGKEVFKGEARHLSV